MYSCIVVRKLSVKITWRNTFCMTSLSSENDHFWIKIIFTTYSVLYVKFPSPKWFYNDAGFTCWISREKYLPPSYAYCTIKLSMSITINFVCVFPKRDQISFKIDDKIQVIILKHGFSSWEWFEFSFFGHKTIKIVFSCFTGIIYRCMIVW